MSKKAVSLIAVLIVIVSFTVGAAFTQSMKDKTDYGFVDDPAVLGKWQTVDFIADIEDFSPDSAALPEGELYLKEYVFIKGGGMLFSVSEGNGNLGPSSDTWTRGMVISKRYETASSYVLKEIEGTQYMFCEWKSGDYIINGMSPYYYVLKKVDSEYYSAYKPTKTEDKIDYPFEHNPKMPGIWESVDFVYNIEDFDPYAPSLIDRLSLKKLEISENGKAAFNGNTSAIKWTGDLILNKVEKTASKCIIKEIGNDTYMFYEWKSGDYVFRETDPPYYVLKKTG